MSAIPAEGFLRPASGGVMDRIMAEAPYLPRCSDDKTATRVRPREYAIRYPYMQINRPGMVSWLIFDLDHKNAMAWEDAGLPAPNLIVRNRQSGHSHLYYAITPVCTSENARHGPIAYMKAIYAAMAIRLKADADFHSGPVAKTPHHPWWLTHELHAQVYELGELADYVELAVASPWGKRVELDEINHSRHCVLFEKLRQYAYSVVKREREEGDYASFVRLLNAFAHSANCFKSHGYSDDLALSSIRATVRSVARWTWSRYTGDGRCHRGVMALDRDLPLAERQRLSAQRTHGIRHQQTENRIRAGVRLLRQRGEALTQVAVARLLGLSRQTVAAYKHVLAEPVQPVIVSLQDRFVNKVVPVNYGAHQVTAPRGAAFEPFRVLELFPDLPETVLPVNNSPGGGGRVKMGIGVS